MVTSEVGIDARLAQRPLSLGLPSNLGLSTNKGPFQGPFYLQFIDASGQILNRRFRLSATPPFVCFSQTFNRGKDDEFKLGRSGGACEWSGQ
jgi:hypothetical protein